MTPYHIYKLFSRRGFICTFKEREYSTVVRETEGTIQCDAIGKRGYKTQLLRFDPNVWRDPIVPKDFGNLAHDSPHHILNQLTDDCLTEIFSQDCITESDLREIVVVCKRFKKPAMTAFRTKHKQKPTNADFNDSMALWEFEAYLRLWGPYIETIRETSTQCLDVTCNIIAANCPNLVNLHTNSYNMSEPAYISLLKKVESLVLQPLGLSEFKYSGLNLCETHLPKLTSLILHAPWLQHPENAEIFFNRNGQLTELIFQKGKVDFGIDRIVSKLPLLQTLILAFNAQCDDYNCFGQLTKLKKFQVDGRTSVDHVLTGLTSANAPLAHLIVRDLEYQTHLTNIIKEFKRLRTLELFNSKCLINLDLIEMIEKFESLYDLRLSSDDGLLTIDGFRAMLSMKHKLRRAIFEVQVKSAENILKTNKTIFADIARFADMESIRVEIILKQFGELVNTSNK